MGRPKELHTSKCKYSCSKEGKLRKRKSVQEDPFKGLDSYNLVWAEKKLVQIESFNIAVTLKKEVICIALNTEVGENNMSPISEAIKERLKGQLKSKLAEVLVKILLDMEYLHEKVPHHRKSPQE